MAEKKRSASNLELVGGRLCLDFANTLSTRLEGGREYLTDYADLVAWGQHAGTFTEYVAQALIDRAGRYPQLGRAALERAIALRETIYRIFSTIAAGRGPERSDLDTLNTALRQAFSRLEVVPSGGGFEWAWTYNEDDLDSVLWPVARSAADTLISGDLGRVRECARQGCDWLFVDTSKNHSRRWCSMATCGSRVKARRYYRRVKKGEMK